MTGRDIVEEYESPDTDFVCESDLQTQYRDTCRILGDRCGFRFPSPAWRLGGWLQQGVTWNAAGPSNASNVPVLFNDRANGYQVNQLYLYLAREVCTDGLGWDLGGRVDVNFGTDSRFVTVPGLEEHENRTAKWNGEDAEYGIALPQAYVELGMPLGPYGSSFRVGHFYALGGYETFAAPDNFFYSHAYTYLYGEPFTFSGGMLLMKVSDTMSLGLAGTTGWDALDGNGDEWGVRLGLMKKSRDCRTTAAVTFHTGQDFTGINTAIGPQGAPRHWASLVVKRCLTEQLYYVFQSDYGYQDDAALLVDAGSNTIGFRPGQWWGINQYLIYDFHPCWSAGLRVEWFRDQDNTRVGVPVTFSPGGPAFDGQDYVGLTAGLHWKPHSNVLLRQEIRWDYSNVESNPNAPGVPAGVRPYNDRRDDNQLTVALDLILLF